MGASLALSGDLRTQNGVGSLINDNGGDTFRGFDDSCWILLTSQRPASQLHSPSKREMKLQAQRNLQALSKPPGTVASSSEKRQTATGRSYRSTSEREISYPYSANSNSGFTPQGQMIMPQKRYAHSACLFDNKLLIYGGCHRSGSGQSPFHSFYECTLQLDACHGEDLFRWRKVQVESPKSRDSHSCVALRDEQMLVFGGRCDSTRTDSVSNNDLYKYSLAQKVWTKLEPLAGRADDLPSPREGHAALLFDGDKMLVHGGIDESMRCFDDAFVLLGLHADLDYAQSLIRHGTDGKIANAHTLTLLRGKREMLRWVRCDQEGDVPSARDSHSATLFNGQIFVFGG